MQAYGAMPWWSALYHAKVLVVTDEATLASELAFALQELRCSVIGPVASAGEAAALALRTCPDAALLASGIGDDQVSRFARTLADLAVPLAIVSDAGGAFIHPAFRLAPRLARSSEPEVLRETLEELLLLEPARARVTCGRA
jgi:DNA-binding NarL/FixJ family response regulator